MNRIPARRDFAQLPSHCLLPIALKWPCTPVDIRWKKAQKVSLCLTFRPARRALSTAMLDPQVVSRQRD
jgi:hypothetical protein